jgi:hypothetical protein
MLYETLLQGQILLGMFYFGLVAGIFFEAKNLMNKVFKNKFALIAGDFVFLIVASFLFVWGENVFNYGEFRVFLLLGYVVGLYLEHITIGFLVEKFLILAYNLISKVLSKIKKVLKHDRKANVNSIKFN